MVLDDLTDVVCFDEQRRAAVLQHPTLNGIDFVEYFEDRTAVPPRYWLVVTFLKDAPDPTSFYNLVGHPELFRIEGGTRVVGIRVTGVTAGSQANQLEVSVSEPGDFSIYRLRLTSAALDPQLTTVLFSFKASCPTEFDCRQEPECPPTLLMEPLLDYLAKDYASFRRLLLDLIPQRNPQWLERNPADLGMALVELLAYAGDQLSYFQDAVATEAYLDTCHQRVSAKRHARLVDYRMHDGRNAWGFVQLDVNAGGAVPQVVPQGTMLLTRIARPLQHHVAPPETTIALAELDFTHDPALQTVTVFETTAQLTTEQLNNRLWIHTWGNRNCCLPHGATGAYLYTLNPGTQQAVRPPLRPGDYLVFEEVKGPATGLAADADPRHRQVVRLVTVEPGALDPPLVDPLYRDTLLDGALQPVTDVTQAPLPLVQVTWREEDALSFALCLSTEHPETGLITNVSIARGNVVPCDHGRTIEESLPLPRASGGRPGLLEVPLSQAPLTFQPGPTGPTGTVDRLRQERHALAASPRQVEPAVQLTIQFPPAEVEAWTPVPDLFEDRAFDRHFVVDVGNDGTATLRFGDDEYGRRPEGVEHITARYRVGNGRAGNLGSDALVHIVSPDDLTHWPDVATVRQPRPTAGGVDAENIEEVRQLAPRAFQAEQFRAVTEADYEAAALTLPAVAAAKCTFRWTGSWHTVFVAIHPRKPSDLITQAGGRTRLRDELAHQVQQQLTRYKLAGYDLEIRTAQYVPLEIDMQICVARGHFRGDVLEAVYRALSNRQFPDGSTGFFHPSRFTFGQAVYLSQLYAAAERVAGVELAVVTVFKRYWALPNDELANGVIPLGDGEIARLDNDPNFAENGVLRLTALGGL
jgi:hypothetical protein